MLFLFAMQRHAAPEAKPLQKLPPRAQVETPPKVPWAL